MVFFEDPMDAFPVTVSDSQLFRLKTRFEGFFFFFLVVCLSLCLEVSEIFHSAVLANSAESVAVAQSLFTAKWESFSTNCHFSENTENKMQPSTLHRGGSAKFPGCDVA